MIWYRKLSSLFLVRLVAEFHIFYLITLHLSTLIIIMSPIFLKNPFEIINLTHLLTVIKATWLHACVSTYLIFMLIHTPQLHTPWCVDEFLSESWHKHTNDQLSRTKLRGYTILLPICQSWFPSFNSEWEDYTILLPIFLSESFPLITMHHRTWI
jgi:hypothetical protein